MMCQQTLAFRHRLKSKETLSSGGVIAYPTEAVFGLGCDPFHEEAVSRLLLIKRRPVKKGLILVAADQQQIQPLISRLSKSEMQRLEESWPGPVTWLLPDPDHWIPQWVKGDFSSVAVRVSAHPVVHSLCRIWGGPIVSTSANQSGQPPVRSACLIRKKYRQGELAVDYIVPGETQKRRNPTEIRDIQSGRIVRIG